MNSAQRIKNFPFLSLLPFFDVLKRGLWPKVSLLLLFSTFSISLFAQKNTIQGRVIDKSKDPLVGANIFLLDTYDGATSDANGNFKFETDETMDKGYHPP